MHCLPLIKAKIMIFKKELIGVASKERNYREVEKISSKMLIFAIHEVIVHMQRPKHIFEITLIFHIFAHYGTRVVFGWTQFVFCS